MFLCTYVLFRPFARHTVHLCWLTLSAVCSLLRRFKGIRESMCTHVCTYICTYVPYPQVCMCVLVHVRTLIPLASSTYVCVCWHMKEANSPVMAIWYVLTYVPWLCDRRFYSRPPLIQTVDTSLLWTHATKTKWFTMLYHSTCSDSEMRIPRVTGQSFLVPSCPE